MTIKEYMEENGISRDDIHIFTEAGNIEIPATDDNLTLEVGSISGNSVWI